MEYEKPQGEWREHIDILPLRTYGGNAVSHCASRFVCEAEALWESAYKQDILRFLYMVAGSGQSGCSKDNCLIPTKGGTESSGEIAIWILKWSRDRQISRSFQADLPARPRYISIGMSESGEIHHRPEFQRPGTVAHR